MDRPSYNNISASDWDQLLEDAIKTNVAIQTATMKVKKLNEKLAQLESELMKLMIVCPKCNTMFHILFENCPTCKINK